MLYLLFVLGDLTIHDSRCVHDASSSLHDAHDRDCEEKRKILIVTEETRLPLRALECLETTIPVLELSTTRVQLKAARTEEKRKKG